MDVLIVGAGRMGRWFGRTLRAEFPETSLSFADADPAVARAAAERLDGRVAPDPGGSDPRDGSDRGEDAPRPTTGDGPFEVVCLAVPIPQVESVAAAHAPRAGRAVCDVVGTMAPAVAALREHAPDRERLSLHPLFAPGNAPGNVAAVGDRGGEYTDRVRRALSAAGNDVVETTPGEHDRAMATVQARTHAAVLAFALAAEEVPEGFETPVYAALSDLAETVLGGDPRVYADVQATFDGAGDVAAAARRVAEADPGTFRDLYREARADRELNGGEGGGDRE